MYNINIDSLSYTSDSMWNIFTTIFSSILNIILFFFVVWRWLHIPMCRSTVIYLPLSFVTI